MKTAHLIRYSKGHDCTLGFLSIEGELFATLEPPWRNNIRNRSCIPSGGYDSHYLHRSASGKYKKVYHVLAVPERSGILIHNGNVVDHTRGCILLGMKHGALGNKRAVLSSRRAMRKIVDVAGTEPFRLEVHG